ncbi:hypothetical protein HK100_006341 [Physocladia obscura]|uniref:Adhesin domain-containing protein n=1 Tax=Physocladia obscura TaxID=109957 RepID=A0AAD5SSM2_9FUNG|nr:hypothetical protein HK100_006341 [Physocladia obscura]
MSHESNEHQVLLSNPTSSGITTTIETVETANSDELVIVSYYNHIRGYLRSFTTQQNETSTDQTSNRDRNIDVDTDLNAAHCEDDAYRHYPNRRRRFVEATLAVLIFALSISAISEYFDQPPAPAVGTTANIFEAESLIVEILGSLGRTIVTIVPAPDIYPRRIVWSKTIYASSMSTFKKISVTDKILPNSTYEIAISYPTDSFFSFLFPRENPRVELVIYLPQYTPLQNFRLSSLNAPASLIWQAHKFTNVQNRFIYESPINGFLRVLSPMKPDLFQVSAGYTNIELLHIEANRISIAAKAGIIEARVYAYIDFSAHISQSGRILAHLSPAKKINSANLSIGVNSITSPSSIIVYESDFAGRFILDGNCKVVGADSTPEKLDPYTGWKGVPVKNRGNPRERGQIEVYVPKLHGTTEMEPEIQLWFRDWQWE